MTATQTQTHTPYFDGNAKLRLLPTSYGNQRGLAARDLGADTLCAHGEKLGDGCTNCRAHGTPVLLKG